jgi:hypothetical protein
MMDVQQTARPQLRAEAGASVLEPMWDIAKRIFDYIQRSRKILTRVRKANKEVFIDIEVKLGYVRKMVNKLSDTYKEIARQVDNFKRAKSDDEKLRCVQIIYGACIDICVYERNLAGTDSHTFDTCRDDLAKGNGPEYRFALKFYAIFTTLLNQSRFGLNGILHAAGKDVVSIDFMFFMLGKVSDAYAEFFDDFGTLVNES